MQNKLKCDKISLGKFKSDTLVDQFFHQPLPHVKGFPPAPIRNFALALLTLNTMILQSKRNVSSLVLIVASNLRRLNS